jgi:hypothetical protein
MTKYDLNVWDYSGYPGYDDEPRWRIDIYECYEDWSHHDEPFKIIFLNELQAKMLTLGVAESDGGDYDWDSDFWIDPDGFLDTYKNIPRKVRRYLSELVESKEELV